MRPQPPPREIGTPPCTIWASNACLRSSCRQRSSRGMPQARLLLVLFCLHCLFLICCTFACSILRPHRWTTTPWLSCRSGRTYSARRTQVSRRWAAGAWAAHCCTAAHWDQFLLFCLHCMHASSSSHVSSVTPCALQARLCSEDNSATRCHQPTGPRVGQGRQAAARRCDDMPRVCACVTVRLQCNSVR